MAGIIVGVDGSHGAHRALEWAMREAAARHAPLAVITVHQIAASGWIVVPVFLPVDEPTVEHARQAAEEAVAKAPLAQARLRSRSSIDTPFRPRKKAMRTRANVRRLHRELGTLGLELGDEASMSATRRPKCSSPR